MKKEQRICVLLAIMILGIWGLEAKSSGSLIPKSWKIRMIQSVQENAERLYMPGVTYTEKKQGEIRVTEAVVHMASALIPPVIDEALFGIFLSVYSAPYNFLPSQVICSLDLSQE